LNLLMYLKHKGIEVSRTTFIQKTGFISVVSAVLYIFITLFTITPNKEYAVSAISERLLEKDFEYDLTFDYSTMRHRVIEFTPRSNKDYSCLLIDTESIFCFPKGIAGGNIMTKR